MSDKDLPNIEITWDHALEILEVLRLTPIYALLNSDHEEELGDDFKPQKWQGYELEHAQKANDAFRSLLAAFPPEVTRLENKHD